jgi:hypothetical protein
MSEIMELHEALDLEQDPRMDYDPQNGPSDVGDIVATTTGAPPTGISFNVEMRGHTMEDMETLIIHAAAAKILGKYQDRQIAKDIQDVCLTQINDKINAQMDSVTTDIMEQPLISGMLAEKNPITMKDYVGLTTRDYLTQLVDENGNTKTSSSYYSTKTTRLEFIVNRIITRQLKLEIEEATHSMIQEIQIALRAEQNRILAEEKAKITAALKGLI